MIILDVNILIYAVNQDAPRHERARSWLETTLFGDRNNRYSLDGDSRISSPHDAPRPFS